VPADSIGHDVAVRQSEWTRIADDLRTTTGRELNLRVTGMDDGWLHIDVQVDGELASSLERHFPEDSEAFVAALADCLCESPLEVVIWGGWPICAVHRTHPPDAVLSEDGQAVWICPATKSVHAPVSSLTAD
jgi:hypothetical protein